MSTEESSPAGTGRVPGWLWVVPLLGVAVAGLVWLALPGRDPGVARSEVELARLRDPGRVAPPPARTARAPSSSPVIDLGPAVGDEAAFEDLLDAAREWRARQDGEPVAVPASDEVLIQGLLTLLRSPRFKPQAEFEIEMGAEILPEAGGPRLVLQLTTLGEGPVEGLQDLSLVLQYLDHDGRILAEALLPPPAGGRVLPDEPLVWDLALTGGLAPPPSAALVRIAGTQGHSEAMSLNAD